MAYGIKDSCDGMFRNKQTGDLVFIPYFNDFTITLAEGNKVEAKAKGVTKISWNSAMEGCKFEGSTQILTDAMLGLLLGCDMLKADTDVFNREKLVVTSGKVSLTTTKTIKPESLSVYKTTSDGVESVKIFRLTGASTPAVGEFKYDPATKAVTFASGDVTNGDVVVVTYLYSKVNTKKLQVKANAIMPSYEYYGNVAVKTEDGVIQLRQLHLPNIQPSRALTLTLSAENASEFKIAGDILADSNDTMLEFIDITE